MPSPVYYIFLKTALKTVSFRLIRLYYARISYQTYTGNIMAEFKNVTVDQAANFYFDGNVTSRTLTFEDGSVKTLGIMMPGEYEFGTAEAEIMDIVAGELDVRLPDSNEFVTIKGGETFEVPANAKFQVSVKTVTDYCCSYIKA